MEGDFSISQIITGIKLVITYLKRKWIIVVLFGLFGCIIGLAYSLSQKTKYIGKLTFAFEDESSKSSVGGLASQFGFDVGGGAGGAFSESNLGELMKSRALVEKALLTRVSINARVVPLIYYYLNPRGDSLDNKNYDEIKHLSYSNRESFTLLQNELLGRVYEKIIRDNLKISQVDRRISIMIIEVVSESEIFSKFFAEILSEVVSDFYVFTKSKKGLNNVQILQKQFDSVKFVLGSAMSGVAQANDNTFNLNSAFNINKVPSSKRQIDVQLNTALLSQLSSNLELARISLRKETPLIQVIDKPILPLKAQKVGRMKSMLLGGILSAGLVVFLLIAKMWATSFIKKEQNLQTNNINKL
ncbi:MAG: hypothetical protein ACK41Z_11265 [Sediminibacterium sp.]